jgi:hypothetical protein
VGRKGDTDVQEFICAGKLDYLAEVENGFGIMADDLRLVCWIRINLTKSTKWMTTLARSVPLGGVNLGDELLFSRGVMMMIAVVDILLVMSVECGMSSLSHYCCPVRLGPISTSAPLYSHRAHSHRFFPVRRQNQHYTHTRCDGAITATTRQQAPTSSRYKLLAYPELRQRVHVSSPSQTCIFPQYVHPCAVVAATVCTSLSSPPTF